MDETLDSAHGQIDLFPGGSFSAHRQRLDQPGSHALSRFRVRGLGVALLGLLLVAGACSGGGDADDSSGERGTPSSDEEATTTTDAEPVPGGVVAFGLRSGSTGWDPTVDIWIDSSIQVALSIFDRLALYDQDGKGRPYLAESIEPNEDFTVWTITMRPDVQFHNGDPVDAEAVALNLELQREGGILSQSLSLIEVVEATGPLTVEVTMSAPWSNFPNQLATQAGTIAAPAMLDGTEGDSANPIGSGPFRMANWIPENTITLERNEDYWRDGYPLLDRLEYKVITDITSRGAAMQSGQVDMFETQDAGLIQEFRGLSDEGVYQAYFTEDDDVETYLLLNTAAPPFDDPIAREAVAYALDTELIAETVYDGEFEPAAGPFAEGSQWRAEADYPEYDLDRAKELVTEYEAAHGEPLSFSINLPSTPEFVEVAQLLQSQVGAAGMQLELNQIEYLSLALAALNGTFEMSGFQGFGFPHPDNNYTGLHSDNATEIGVTSLNTARLKSPTIDEAMETARATDDFDAQYESYAVMQEELAKELPYIWLVHNQAGIVAENDIRDITSWEFPDGAPGNGLTNASVMTYQIWIEQ